jgi:hypothetical protein
MVRDPMYEDGPPPSLTIYWDPSVVDDATKKSTTKLCNDTFEQKLSLGSMVVCTVSAMAEPTKFQVWMLDQQFE